jgi:sRNA-binding carbon storage regulator CsrA
VAEDESRKIGTLLEQLGARFDLVIEAVTGFGGRLDALREEVMGQFGEVGRQIRFLADRIAENREAVALTRADLGAEMIRIGENLGATRVETRENFLNARIERREEIQAIREELRNVMAAETESARARNASEIARATEALETRLEERFAALGEELRRQIVAVNSTANDGVTAAASAEIRAGLASSTDAIVKKIDHDLKATAKTLTALMRKFERFDDRITVQTKDQDQRLKKLERKTAARG